MEIRLTLALAGRTGSRSKKGRLEPGAHSNADRHRPPDVQSPLSHYTDGLLRNGLVFKGSRWCNHRYLRVFPYVGARARCGTDDGHPAGLARPCLGQQFIKGIMERLQGKSIRSVSLLVSEDNRRAVRVYGDTGFEVVERMAEDPRTGERFLLMRAVLPSPAPLQEVKGAE